MQVNPAMANAIIFPIYQLRFLHLAASLSLAREKCEALIHLAEPFLRTGRGSAFDLLLCTQESEFTFNSYTTGKHAVRDKSNALLKALP